MQRLVGELRTRGRPAANARCRCCAGLAAAAGRPPHPAALVEVGATRPCSMRPARALDAALATHPQATTCGRRGWRWSRRRPGARSDRALAGARCPSRSPALDSAGRPSIAGAANHDGRRRHRQRITELRPGQRLPPNCASLDQSCWRSDPRGGDRADRRPGCARARMPAQRQALRELAGRGPGSRRPAAKPLPRPGPGCMPKPHAQRLPLAATSAPPTRSGRRWAPPPETPLQPCSLWGAPGSGVERMAAVMAAMREPFRSDRFGPAPPQRWLPGLRT